MSSIEDYDGLCGVIHVNSTSDRQVRCSYYFGHEGDHSWKKYIQEYPLHMFIHDTTIKKEIK